MDLCVTETTRLGSGPISKGRNQPNNQMYALRKDLSILGIKFHKLSVLTISFPNRMSTIIEYS